MKVFKYLLISMMFSLNLFASDNEPKKYEVNIEESHINWEGTRVGSGHDGKLSLSKGHLLMQGRDIVGGEFTIDMTSIVVLDIKDESRNKRLRDHLFSDDFFSVEKHPTAKIEIMDATLGKGGAYDIVGNLTIKGITQPVMFSAEVDDTEEKVSATSDFTIDRTKWEVRYRSGSFFDSLGDRLIHDDIKIGVRLVADKK